MTKTVYEAPKVAELGSFETMTRGTTTGFNADQVIPTGASTFGKTKLS